MKFRALWFLEAVLVLVFLFVLLVPMQDYAMREFKEYLQNPSPQTMKVFRDMREKEFQVRRYIAVALSAAIVLIAIPIFRLRHKSSS